jgi:hypothetical protein
MFNERKSVRYLSHARARITGVFEGEALLKDLSVTGCCIECTMVVDIKPNVVYKIEILPEDTSNIGNFDLKAEARWTRMGGYSCEVGFLVVSSPKGKLFQRYVDYLAWRSK